MGMKENLTLETELQKLKDALDRREKMDEMKSVLDKLTTVKNQLREAILKNQEKDKIIFEKDEEIEAKQNEIYQMQNDRSERENEIEKQRNIINDLRYKIKDDAERFESQFEETMMMHSRQLQSLRQSSVDPNQVTRLEAEVKRVRDEFKSEKAARNEEKLNYETIVHNLRGHMLNIYSGNVSPEMAQVLNQALKLERRKQNKIAH